MEEESRDLSSFTRYKGNENFESISNSVTRRPGVASYPWLPVCHCMYDVQGVYVVKGMCVVKQVKQFPAIIQPTVPG